jgi:hypothetical protein
MNQLLFRVFDNKFKRMSLPFSFKDITGKWGCIDFRDDRGFYGLSWEGIEEEPDRFIIMQYTGKETFHDKKEKIFKDDYIKVTYGDVGEVVYHVDWEDMDCGFIFVNIKDKTDRLLWWQIETNDMAESIEILGNVHEHKHLLEAADGN